MFPTRILIAVDGFRETSPAVQAAVETARGTGSELHVVHVVPMAPELPYLHLAAKEGVEDFCVEEVQRSRGARRTGKAHTRGSRRHCRGLLLQGGEGRERDRCSWQGNRRRPHNGGRQEAKAARAHIRGQPCGEGSPPGGPPGFGSGGSKLPELASTAVASNAHLSGTRTAERHRQGGRAEPPEPY